MFRMQRFRERLAALSRWAPAFREIADGLGLGPMGAPFRDGSVTFVRLVDIVNRWLRWGTKEGLKLAE
jgi:hypothetical protein